MQNAESQRVAAAPHSALRTPHSTFSHDPVRHHIRARRPSRRRPAYRRTGTRFRRSRRRRCESATRQRRSAAAHGRAHSNRESTSCIRPRSPPAARNRRKRRRYRHLEASCHRRGDPPDNLLAWRHRRPCGYHRPHRAARDLGGNEPAAVISRMKYENPESTPRPRSG